MDTTLQPNLEQLKGPAHIEWRTASGLTPYPLAISTMEERVEQIRKDGADELVWLVEHPTLYTSGTSASTEDLLTPDRFPVYDTGRGGQYTYHGPGQRVAYAMLDLRRRGQDLRAYVRGLESWVIHALDAFGIHGEQRDGRVGIWVAHSDGTEDKIAAIGVRVRSWVTYHGISINLAPDLEHFSGIVPCGIGEEGLGVTSLQKLGVDVTMDEVDAVLKSSFERVFGAS